MIDLILIDKHTGVFGDKVSIKNYIFSGAEFRERGKKTYNEKNSIDTGAIFDD